MLHTPPWLHSLIEKEALPNGFASLAMDYYLPLADAIQSWAQSSNTPLVIGINGAQGTGKSTMSKVLALALEHKHSLKTAIISIDDIYLTRAERTQLATEIHPLFQTRGVPGTHDTELGIQLIQQLKDGKTPLIPVFNKATDDRAEKDQWITLDQPVDIILFEGWCVGAIAQSDDLLETPCNQLEADEDSGATWRTFANQQLQGSYTELFQLIDKLVMLKAPDFECVYQWRKTQEEKLRNNTQGDAIMNEQQIARFIMHYERLTRWMFEEMPQRANCTITLSPDHSIAQVDYQNN